MCGRYANHTAALRGWAEVLADWPGESARLSYNVTPTQSIPVLRSDGAFNMRWGLVPHWSKAAETRYATFNARLESVAEKPAFRDAWRRVHTCLIPALGYYEWLPTDTGKQPYFVRSDDAEPLVFAGLWDGWGRGDERSLSCTILTREALPYMADLHPRMPVVLNPEQARAWLAGEREVAAQAEAGFLARYPVSKRVNSPANDDVTLTEAIRD